MASWGKCDFKQLKNFQERLQKLEKNDFDAFCESCAKELAARLLAKVIKRTPVGKYDKPVKFTTKDGRQVSFTPHTGKKGGTLRRGWTAKTEAEAKSGGKSDVQGYVSAMPITKTGNVYQVEIINPVTYASYVEFGHRTRNHEGWAKGKFMLTISEDELQAQSPKILEGKLKKYLEAIFND